jgi:hypothetical protein
MLEDKAEGSDVAPSMNSEERPNLEDYKSKDKGSSSTSNTAKTTDFTSVTTVPTPEGDVQVKTELEIPLENNKENVPRLKHCPKKNLRLQQFLKKNFLKDQMKCKRIVPLSPSVVRILQT